MAPSITPASSHAFAIASTRAVVTSIGFSTSTCFPPRASASTASRCAPLAVVTVTTSTSSAAARASRSSYARMPCVSAKAFALSALRDATPTSSPPTMSRMASAWNLPIALAP